MTTPDDETHIAVVVEAPLARPVDQGLTPAQLYVGGLQTAQSRRTAIESLRRLLTLLGASPDEWATFPYERLTVRETQPAQTILVERYAPATAKLTKSVLLGVLRQCFTLGLMSAEQFMRATTLPKIRGKSARVGRMLKPDEIKKLVDYLDQQGTTYAEMAAALFAVGVGGGLRRDELTTLPLDAYDATEKTLRFVGKGRKQRVQHLPAWAAERLEYWLKLRGAREASTMFLRASGGKVHDAPPTLKSTWAIVDHVRRAAGLEHLSPHDLRRTFASNMIEAGDLSLAQQAMAHEDASTTMRYDRRGEQRVREVIDQLPGNGFERKVPMKKTIEVDNALKATVGERMKLKPTIKKAPAEEASASAGAATQIPTDGEVPTPPQAAQGGMGVHEPRNTRGETRRESSERQSRSQARRIAIQRGEPFPEFPSEPTAVSAALGPTGPSVTAVDGQPLVRRRLVGPVKFRRNGAPLDMEWAYGQVRGLIAAGKSEKVILAALKKVGITRGDGSELEQGDIHRLG